MSRYNVKRRYKPMCSHQQRKGTARWRVQDGDMPGAAGGYYFTTKADAKEYADELEAAHRTEWEAATAREGRDADRSATSREQPGRDEFADRPAIEESQP